VDGDPMSDNVVPLRPTDDTPPAIDYAVLDAFVSAMGTSEGDDIADVVKAMEKYPLAGKARREEVEASLALAEAEAAVATMRHLVSTAVMSVIGNAMTNDKTLTVGDAIGELPPRLREKLGRLMAFVGPIEVPR
jgi:hypothetical protein